MKGFQGKAIYNPSGKAREYARWACNFYVGCSNGCTYCYLKKGIGASILGGSQPKLKKCFKDEDHALKTFEKELIFNNTELQREGLFFSFTTDPMSKETFWLTTLASMICSAHKVPVKILTKCTEWVEPFLNKREVEGYDKRLVAIGLTLTGCDDREPGASPNGRRIDYIGGLHDAGFLTFVSIEPILNLEDSKRMIKATLNYCNQYLIGLESGRKYERDELVQFYFDVVSHCKDIPLYWKESFTKKAGIDPTIGETSNVGQDWNIFKTKVNY